MAGPTEAELDARIAAVLAAGKPGWWDSERSQSVIFERYAAWLIETITEGRAC